MSSSMQMRFVHCPYAFGETKVLWGAPGISGSNYPPALPDVIYQLQHSGVLIDGGAVACDKQQMSLFIPHPTAMYPSPSFQEPVSYRTLELPSDRTTCTTAQVKVELTTSPPIPGCVSPSSYPSGSPYSVPRPAHIVPFGITPTCARPFVSTQEPQKQPSNPEIGSNRLSPDWQICAVPQMLGTPPDEHHFYGGNGNKNTVEPWASQQLGLEMEEVEETDLSQAQLHTTVNRCTCTLTRDWRRLRLKRGVKYYLCASCGAKWKVYAKK